METERAIPDVDTAPGIARLFLLDQKTAVEMKQGGGGAQSGSSPSVKPSQSSSMPLSQISGSGSGTSF